MSRPSFRPRPLDIHQKLAVVRDPKEALDDLSATRAVHHSHVALDKDNDQVQTVQTKKGQHEIPVPDVNIVESYETDVKPNYVQHESYVRFTGNGLLSEDFAAYDLDNSDDEWLKQYNGNQNRLPAEKFECMLYKLEKACHLATDKKFHAEAGAALERGIVISLSERQAMVASTSCLPQEEAIELLKLTSTREAVCAAVYQYWVSKRAKWGKPLMRPYQMPPPVTDTNPFNVFRPREKISRPQTRRKRENDLVAFEKMQEIRLNMEKGIAVLEAIHKRERRKRDLLAIELELQMMQVRLRHEPRSALHDGVDEATIAALGRTGKLRNDRAVDRSAIAPSTLPTMSLEKAHAGIRKHKHGKKKRRDRELRDRQTILKQLAPPPPPPQPQMLFALDIDLDKLAEMKLPADVDLSRCRPRFGRGGRIVFDRCNPLPHASSDSNSNSNSGNPLGSRVH
mmetsp:Transcript_22142/g.48595  ORF Transcript_22142/g.48595 Transcript_22142/m.48595 type:complete len:454 (-) Transcript_22142:10-1371(-)